MVFRGLTLFNATLNCGDIYTYTHTHAEVNLISCFAGSTVSPSYQFHHSLSTIQNLYFSLLSSKLVLFVPTFMLFLSLKCSCLSNQHLIDITSHFSSKISLPVNLEIKHFTVIYGSKLFIYYFMHLYLTLSLNCKQQEIRMFVSCSFVPHPTAQYLERHLQITGM